MATCAAGWALCHAAPAAAACNSWQVDRELSLRHAGGWTMLKVRQDGDRISGTATRTGPGAGNAQGGGSVQGRVQPQRGVEDLKPAGGTAGYDPSVHRTRFRPR